MAGVMPVIDGTRIPRTAIEDRIVPQRIAAIVVGVTPRRRVIIATASVAEADAIVTAAIIITVRRTTGDERRYCGNYDQ